MRISGRSDGGIATGSITPNTPSRAKIKPAWPRRTRLVSVEITGRDLAVLAGPRGVQAQGSAGTRSGRPARCCSEAAASQAPAGMQSDNAAAHQPVRDAGKSGRAHHLRESL